MIIRRSLVDGQVLSTFRKMETECFPTALVPLYKTTHYIPKDRNFDTHHR